MNRSAVTKQGVEDPRPPREALTGVAAGRRDGSRRRSGGGEERMVPRAELTSYYGQPIINPPVWAERDIAGYFFLGGLAGASSVVAAGAQLTGRPALARVAKTASTAAAGLSVAALIHDLGRPVRFFNMLRVFKPTSPMSVGSWILAAYVPSSAVATATALTGRLPRLGVLATSGAAALGPPLAAYTAALITNTAVPAWHEAWREMPVIFVSSAAVAGAGVGVAGAPLREAAPARRLAVAATAVELVATKRMERRLGMLAEPYHEGPAGRLMRASQVLTAGGALLGATAGARNRAAAIAAGAALVAGSACTRFGIFRAGVASARDPRYSVGPQRARADGHARTN